MEPIIHHPKDVYRHITAQIATAIVENLGRFQMPWHRRGAGLARPVNALTGNSYRGVNVVALWAGAERRGFATGAWATYRQWNQLGAQIRKGEKGMLTVFYKRLDGAVEEGADEEQAARLVARASFVFNADQVDGWRPPEPPTTPASPVHWLERVEQFVKATGATVEFKGLHAFYSPSLDKVWMPPREVFVGTDTSTPTESFYAVLLHELVHWSGHPSRLDRDFSNRYGDLAYAEEELTAELGAAFLCADLRVTNDPRPDHAAYAKSWLRLLGDDPRAIFVAASKASAAADFLTSLQERH
jgi:antirestriction protein ArdC